MKHVLMVAALLSVLSSTATAQGNVGKPADAATPLALGETFTITSKVLGERRRINVYAPPGFTADSGARLPVLYMPDGGLGEDFPHVAGLIQVSVVSGMMRPFLLVGIENTERRRDMTGPTDSDEDKRIAVRVGGSAVFRRFIRTELMPQVRRRYRTTDETAIVGESLAGLFVVETLFLEPDLFDTYLAFDPSLWWNRRSLVNDASVRLRSWPGAAKTLYLANSAEPEMVELTGRLAEVLQQGGVAGLTWHYDPLPAETHATIYHPAALRAFRALFKPSASR
jgi:predicted alpha/beta superfamily hydrolase